MGLRLFVRRVAAYLVDIVVLFGVLAPLAYFGERLLRVQPEGGFQIWLATVVTFSIPVWIYFTLSDASPSGATLGKRLMHLRVRLAAGEQRLTLGTALVRTALRLMPWELAHLTGFALADVVGPAVQIVGLVVSNLLVLAFLYVCLSNGGRWSLHDMVVGTMVVAAGRAGAAEGGASEQVEA